MECNEALTLISGHIDSSNTEQEEAALQAHLAECADCRALLKAYEDINGNVAELNVPAPEGLVSSVMEKITTPAKTKSRSPWRSIGMSAGLVAAVLVLLIGTKTIKLPDLSDNRAEIMTHAVSDVPAEYATDAPAYYEPPVTDAPGFAADEMPENLPEQGDEGKTKESISMQQTADYEGELTPNSQSNHLKRRLGLSFDPDVLQHCLNMSEDNFAAVLLYDGVDASFFDWLKEQAPEFAEQFEANSEMTVDEQTGTITIRSDYATVMALHEWLLGQICAERDPEQTGELTAEDLEELGLDADVAERVYTFPQPDTAVAWPESWAKDFSLRWLTGENWRLFYPEEEYLPAEEDLAFMVLIPPTDTDEAIR